MNSATSKRVETKRGTAHIDGVYTNPSNAFTAAARWNLWVVQGDEGQFWTATPKHAARLESAGYEII